MFTFSKKLEIWRFSRRSRAVQKSVMPVQSGCFANINLFPTVQKGALATTAAGENLFIKQVRLRINFAFH